MKRGKWHRIATFTKATFRKGTDGEVTGTESNLFNCLEIVNIYDFKYPEPFLEVAKFVMSTAPVLEKLNIRDMCVDDLMDGLEFLKELASFPRLSKMAQIVFSMV